MAPRPQPAGRATPASILRQHKYTGAVGADPVRPGGRFPADGGPANLMPDQSVAANYFKADIQVEYSRITYALKPDADTPADQEYLRYMDVGAIEPSEDVFTLPGHALNYLRTDVTAPPPSNPPTPHLVPLGYNVPRINCVFDVVMTWRRLPTDLIDLWHPGPWLNRLYGDPWAAAPVKPYIGTVNKTRFAGFPPGTLLFKTWRPVRRPAPFLIYTPPDSLSGQMTYLTPAVEWDVELHFRYDPQGHLYKFYNDPPPPDASRSGKGASGLYFVGRGYTYHPPGSVPDDYSLFNEREFKDLFKVTA